MYSNTGSRFPDQIWGPDQISAIVLSNLGPWLTGPGHFQQRTADSAFFQSSNVVQKASHFSECYDIQVQKHSPHLYIVAARNASHKSVTLFLIDIL